MNITTKTENGKHIAEVRNGAGVVFKTAAYLTEAMALADAQCWVAFHGGETMGKITVDMNETYCARQAVTQIMAEVPAENVRRAVESAYAAGLVVEIKRDTLDHDYIEISNGKGSSYGKFHIGADFLATFTRKYLGITMLTPRSTETVTRPEQYGRADYFGKIEIFDAIDRMSGEPVPYQVHRVDHYDITVNGPKGYVQTGLSSLRDAVELINKLRG
ncbi:hypothetical protein PV343_01390 [Streptomyces sp. WI03-4A]|uniref:hypothetical protein n=1 Tax=Streptomyces sp. WI03-4A TaxID=3028706 RepID=UPI0029B2EE60|nr:hypothetical protein [Streptomyces sp. WI03-4A]MDX2590978.1 hypothetical protein [Streptomyces sp. WI03-4A]